MEIYKITNLKNGMCYIGRTKYTFRYRYNSRDDWWNAPSKYISPYLRQAIKHYGHSNFKVQILFTTNCFIELCKKEAEYILKYKSFRPLGYNLTNGGETNDRCVESRKKQSETMKQKYASGEITPHNLGKTHSEETRKKIGDAGRGRPAWNKGVQTGPMTQESIRASAKAHRKPIKGICKATGKTVEYEAVFMVGFDGFNPPTVSKVLNKQLKSHKGYIWEFIIQDNNKCSIGLTAQISQ